ncbi:hypothetical protein [Enterococcus ureasiticus]|uniref:Uncharacterized protein n=1 Tax=Enterococcus ureasiticus TaxID=903984 RepID=A0A1E5GMX1_9ENTE|nr:hypothetical protein [Enterococcus ureasiticus]OEG14047.1 hypothetical protein BCR21_03385 [Enterococcus ureasiticus]
MEKWIDRFSGLIQHCGHDYLVSIKSGDMDGLILELEYRKDEKEKVVIDFFATKAMRVADEGMYLRGIFCDEEIEKFKGQGFESVIYEMQDGDFGNLIKKTSGGLYEHLNMKHYIIITLNFVIEVISEMDPDITILNK